eukprot:31007-Pelagococcus_subviridis.AAC.6
MSAPAEGKSRARDIVTDSGCRCSMTLVSTSPACSPCLISSSSYKPSGTPNENQLTQTTNIPNLLRRSLATMSITCG